MCSNSIICCPLCSQPAFTNSDTLRLALVSVATRNLQCPVCSDLFLGIDKLTIHLFGHLHGLIEDKSRFEQRKVQLKPSNLYSNNDLVNKRTNFSNKSNEVTPMVAPLANDNGVIRQNLKNSVFLSINPVNSISYQNENKSLNSIIDNKSICQNDNLKSIFSPDVFTTTVNSQPDSRNSDDLETSANFSNTPQTTIVKRDELSSCDICGFKFNDRKILEMHKRLVHSNVELRTNGETILPCHLCSKKFHTRGSFMIHLRVAHHGFQKLARLNLENSDVNSEHLACNICSKVFLKQQQLSVHLKKHDTKQWECDICSKTFTTKYFLKKHKRLHTGEMPYNCAQCNKSFTFQQSYHKHMLYHSTEKPHTCGQCGRAFKELSTLHNHERIHSGERPFSCDTCGKCFRQRVSCLVHRRIHTGAMPYHCTACGKKFRYKVSQRTHKCPSQPPGVVIRSETGNLLQHFLIQSTEKSTNSNSEQNFQPENVGENSKQAIYPPESSNDTTDLIADEFLNNRKDVDSEVGLKTAVDSKSRETSGQPVTDNHLDIIKNTDFFSLVLSPMNIESPSEKMQNLNLSSTSSVEGGHSNSGYETSNAISVENTFFDICNDNSEFHNNGNGLPNTTLQTINEESLKQLLYGPSNI